MHKGPVDDDELDMEKGFVDDDEINRLTGEGGVATELDHRPPTRPVHSDTTPESNKLQ